MRVIRTYYARMLRVNDEYKYASGSVCAIHKKLTDIQTDQGASMDISFSFLVLSNINSTINGLLKFKVTDFD